MRREELVENVIGKIDQSGWKTFEFDAFEMS